MKQIILYRSDFSSYFASDFDQLEKQRLLSVAGQYQCQADYTTSLENDDQREVVILTNSQTDFTQFSAQLLKRTSLIIHANSGYDNIPTDFVSRAHFPIVIGNEIRAEAVATYVLSCLFQYYANPPFTSEWDSKRSWKRPLLSSLNILLLGHGHIGKIVHLALKALGADVQIYDPFKNEHFISPALADVVIPLMSLNYTSRQFINKDFLSKLKSNVLIINGARGDLIDQQAMVDFLTSSPEAFAYLDVFEEEPFDFKKLSHLKNAKLSSHVAGVYCGLDRNLIEYEARVLSHFLANVDTFMVEFRDSLLAHRLIGGELI